MLRSQKRKSLGGLKESDDVEISKQVMGMKSTAGQSVWRVKILGVVHNLRMGIIAMNVAPAPFRGVRNSLRGLKSADTG